MACVVGEIKRYLRDTSWRVHVSRPVKERTLRLCKALDELMFSESHSRYVIGTKEPKEVRRILPSEGVAFAEIGKTASGIKFVQVKKTIRLTLKQLQISYESLEKTMQS